MRALGRSSASPRQTVGDAVAGRARLGRRSIDLRALARASRRGRQPGDPADRAAEGARRAADPDAAAWVHSGATSQDIMDSALMIVAARRAAESIVESLWRPPARSRRSRARTATTPRPRAR